MESVPSSKKNSKNELSSFLAKHDFSSTTFTKVVTYRIDYISEKATFSKNGHFIWPFLKNTNEEQINEIKTEIEDLKKTSEFLFQEVRDAKKDITMVKQVSDEHQKRITEIEDKMNDGTLPPQMESAAIWPTRARGGGCEAAGCGHL